MNITRLPEWQGLIAHQRELTNVRMRDLFDADSERFERFSLEAAGLFVDYSRNRVTGKTLERLQSLARAVELPVWIERMFNGDRINTTEKRAVLHTALRNRSDVAVHLDGQDIMPDVRAVLAKMDLFVSAVHEERWRGFRHDPIRNIVNIGIGGSELGPAMVCEALKPWRVDGIHTWFVSNVDGAHLAETLRRVDAASTLFIVSSKTFTTQETMSNAHAARAWLIDELGDESAVAHHFVAVSTNAQAVSEFGIDPNNMFEFWDWVGGRYSLWSAIGLSIALSVGMRDFEALLEGAHAMDRHFREAPLEQNLPVVLALLGIWYGNFFGAETHAIVPYEQNLHRLPAFVQQVDMESNGKSVTRDGTRLTWSTSPVIWGEPGTNSQHAFFQLLHQGTRLVPVDFIVAASSCYPFDEQHELLLANCLAQASALMRGLDAEEVSGDEALAPHRACGGNQPSNLILMQRLDPFSLGSLIALYEHKIFCQGVVWQVNTFDQWGVELGKRLAQDIRPLLDGVAATADTDQSTIGVVKRLRAWRS